MLVHRGRGGKGGGGGEKGGEERERRGRGERRQGHTSEHNVEWHCHGGNGCSLFELSGWPCIVAPPT